MTPNQVSQYLGRRNDNLKLVCKTLLLLTVLYQLVSFAVLQFLALYLLKDEG